MGRPGWAFPFTFNIKIESYDFTTTGLDFCEACVLNAVKKAMAEL